MLAHRTPTAKTFSHYVQCDDGALQEIIDEIFGEDLDDAAPTTADEEATAPESAQLTRPNRYIQLSSMPADGDESQSDCLCADSRKAMVFRETTV